MDEECVLDRMSLVMGYAGVYSSFLKHAYRGAERYEVSGAEILLECGRQRLVGGQEDQIIQIAVGPRHPEVKPSCHLTRSRRDRCRGRSPRRGPVGR